MRIELDENVPAYLIAELTALGHDVHYFGSRVESGAPDPNLWEIVQKDRRLVISHDVGFADKRKIELTPHCGFVLLRLVQNERAITERVRQVFQTEPVESWHDCIVVVTAKRVRVRRRPKS